MAESIDFSGFQGLQESAKFSCLCAINAKTLQVNFNKAVAEADQADVTFDVKRGSFATTVTPTWAADGMSVELARNTNLIAGTYTVTVAGIDLEVDSGTVVVEAQKISSLEIATDNVVKNAAASIVYDAKDQYGDKMDVTRDKFTWAIVNLTDSTRTVAVAGAGTDKVLKINTTANAQVDDVLRVTGLLNADPTVKVIKEITVSNVFIQDFELNNVVLPDGETRLNEATSAYDVELNYSSVDNYGNEMLLPASAGPSATIGNITFVSSDTAIVDPANMATDADSKLTFQVEANAEGTVVLTALNNNTGATSSLEVEVFATAEATTVEFGEATLIEGDTPLELPVTFFDQYGEAIPATDTSIQNKALSALGFNASAVGSPGSLNVGSTSADGKNIVLTGSTEGTYTLTLVNTTTGVTASTPVVVNEERLPAELLVVTAPDATVGVTGSTDVTFNVKDQYGEDMTFAAIGTAGYQIDATVTGTNVSITNDPLISYTETITASSVGTDKVTFELTDGATVIDSKVFDIEVIADLASLDVTVDKTEYTAGETATVTIKAEKTGNVLLTDFNKTGVATITVGSKSYLRTVTFVNGVTTTTVPVVTAGTTVAINAVFDTKTDGTAPAPKVVAAAASKLAVDGSNDVFVADEFGNKADYNFTGIATVTTDGTFTPAVNAENQVQLVITNGDVKDTSAANANFTGSEKTLTLALANGDVFSITLP